MQLLELGRVHHLYFSLPGILFSYFYFSVGKEITLKPDFNKICLLVWIFHHSGLGP